MTDEYRNLNTEVRAEAEKPDKTKTEPMTTTLLPFSTIDNLRDLGGLYTPEGKMIKPGRLFRSANLHHASQHDLDTLNLMGLKKVFDLRTEWEVAAEPDHLHAGWKLFHEPLLHETTLASQFGSELNFVKSTVEDMNETMKDAYILMFSSERGKESWKVLFKELLKDHSPVLWHCTEGKDRTGMTAALIEHALGIEEELILKDYLETNTAARRLIQKDEDEAAHIPGFGNGVLKEDVKDFVTASPAYYQAADSWIKSGYGSWKGYLKQEVGLSDADFERLETLWLQDSERNL